MATDRPRYYKHSVVRVTQVLGVAALVASVLAGCQWANVEKVCFAGDTCADGGQGGGGGGDGGGSKEALLTGDRDKLDLDGGGVGDLTAAVAWRLNNAGGAETGTLNFSNVPPELSVDNRCPATLPAGASCTIFLKFKPSSPGLRTAHLDVSADPGGTASVDVRIEGLWHLRVTLLNPGSGGSVQSPAGQIACGPACTGLYPNLKSVTLVPVTANGSRTRFVGWGGLPQCALGKRSCTFNMNQDENVVAEFAAIDHNLAFVTSATFGANLGGQAMADTLCNQLASLAGINTPSSDGFIAWLSTSTSQAGDRIPQGAGGFIRLDGSPFAVSGATLRANQILAPLNIDELGSLTTGIDSVFTGISPDGGVTGSTCFDWRSMDPTMRGSVGNIQAGPGVWEAAADQSCNSGARLYCLEVKGASIAPFQLQAVPAGKKVAYLSSSDFFPGSGVSPDQHCNLPVNRPMAYPARTFVAFVATAGGTALSRITLAADYFRVDGVRMANGGELFSWHIPNGLWVTNNGGYAAPHLMSWSGALTPTSTAGPDGNCNNWTSDAGTGHVGDVSLGGFSPGWFGAADASCATGHPLICIEP